MLRWRMLLQYRQNIQHIYNVCGGWGLGAVTGSLEEDVFLFCGRYSEQLAYILD